jgi:hypothetical protein
MRTLVLEFEGVDPITVKRPAYSEMREVGPMIERLFAMATPGAVIYSPEFERVLAMACNTSADLERAMGLDHNEMWSLWTSYIEFARFEDFFAEATEQQLARQTKMEEHRMRATMRQLDMMKKSGLVPADLSIESVLMARFQEAMSQEPSPNGEPAPVTKVDTATFRTPSSSTSSPPSTDGRRRK